MASYLGVVAIRPDPRSVGPIGHHLRWSFPAERGFPPDGFRVFRRKSSGAPAACRAFADAVPGGRPRRLDRWSADGIAFQAPPGLTLTAVPGRSWLDCETAGGPPQLRVDFSAPVVTIEVRFAGGGATPTLRAFEDGRLVAESHDATAPDADGVRAIRVSGPVMTSATVSVTFAELHAVCRLTLESACAGPWGPPRHLPLPAPPSTPSAAAALVETILGPDTRNRYVASLDEAVARYGPEAISLLEWLRALLDPEGRDSTGRRRMADPDPAALRPASRLVVGRGAGSPLDGIRGQAVLLLAALDPNIARLLRLGWVDRDVDPDDKGDVFDYKVEGLWPDGRLCGVALEVGRAVAERPRLSTHPPGESVVLRGVRWRGREPRRRVGVRWAEPPGPGPQGAPTRAVLFDVARDGPPGAGLGATGPGHDPARRAGEPPVLVSRSAWATPGAPCFVDSDVPLGHHTYRVRPIDVFGQVGATSPPIGVEVVDDEAPPPPARLAARLDQPGYPWRTPGERLLAGPDATLLLTFEYGALQDRAAPDVAEFVIYGRAGGLVEEEAAVTVTGVEPRPAGSDGRIAYAATVTGVAADRLAGFAGGLLSRLVPVATSAGTRLRRPRAGERRRWRIASIEDGTTRILTAPSAEALTSGSFRLTSDPHDRAGWTELARIAARRPVSGRLRQVALTRDVAFRRLPPPVAAADPLDRLPAGRRPAAPPPPATIEVSIDHALLEPDVLAGGTATIGGTALAIAASTAGMADDGAGEAPPPRSARLRLLDPGAAVPATGVLTLAAPPPDPAAGRGRLRWLVLDGPVPTGLPAGGELGFRPPREGERGIVAQVLSPVEGAGAGFRVLARFSPSLRAPDLPGAGAWADYFAPYAASVAVGVVTDAGATPAAPLRLQVAPYDGAVSAYVAVAATDARDRPRATGPQDEAWDRNLGALSAPVQVVAVRPPPTVTPAAPFPCGQPPPADGYATVPDPAGRATVPDPAGRATVCLAWTPLPGELAYEVGRALDEAVISTHWSRWLRGEADASDPVAAGPLLVGRIGAAPVARAGGVFEASLLAAAGGDVALVTDAAVVATLAGGRLRQGAAYFQITGARLTGGALVATLRPLRPADVPASGGCEVEGAPSYAAIRAALAERDAGPLRALAGRPGLEDAFGLATGVPLSAHSFVDQVPGRGRSAFLYRIRGVDPAGHRTAWSPVSPAFWQADATTPATPGSFRAFAGGRSALLSWTAPLDPSVSGYRVYRIPGADPTAVPDPALATILTVDATATAPRRPAVVAGTVSVPPRAPDAVAERTVVRAAGGGGIGPNLFVAPSALTRLAGLRIESVNPLVPDGTPVQVRLDDPVSPLVLTRRPGSGVPLAVTGAVVDLAFDLDVTAIESVLPATEVAEDADLEARLAVPSLLDLAEDAIVDGLTVAQLDDVAPDGLAVVAIVRLGDGSLRAIRHAPGGLEPLRVAGGAVRLDLAPPESLVGVVEAVAAPDDGAGSPPAPADLRLTEASALRIDPADGRVTGVTGLNPLVPSGMEVVVTFVDALDRASVYEGDPSVRTWRDSGLEGDLPHAYFLAAVREVTAGRAGGGPPVVREVRSRLAGPALVTPLDRA